MAKKRVYKKVEGECNRSGCHNAVTKYKVCDYHREMKRAWDKKKRLEGKPEGLCHVSSCKEPSEEGYVRCSKHREATRKNALLQYAKDQKSKDLDQCKTPFCKNQAQEDYSFCEMHRERMAARDRSPEMLAYQVKRRLKLRLEVLAAYGGICKCCGEKNLKFLTIDHIERHKSGPRAGSPLYAWLKKNSYPEGFRVLCLKCNTTLGRFGYCPHSDLKQPLKERPRIHPVTEKNLRIKARNLALKLKTFEAYGGAHCNCCSESNHECLCIDHINNWGADHRREIGVHLGAWLRKNNYPPGFQVLCYNCNWAKDQYGICPHKETFPENPPETSSE